MNDFDHSLYTRQDEKEGCSMYISILTVIKRIHVLNHYQFFYLNHDNKIKKNKKLLIKK